jgi:hypothetical protein
MTSAIRYLRALADIQFDIGGANHDDPLYRELRLAIDVLSAFADKDRDYMEDLWLGPDEQI